MAREKVVKLRKSVAPEVEAAVLAPGIHPGKIELRAGDSYRVRMLTGALFGARLAEDMDPAFAEECLRQKRTVIVSAMIEKPQPNPTSSWNHTRIHSNTSMSGWKMFAIT